MQHYSLNEMKGRLKEWWSHLALREKRVVGIGSALFVIFVFYAGIWSPLNDKAASLRQAVINNQATLVWMRETDKQLRVLESKTKHEAASLTPIALLSILKNKINEMNLTPYLTQLKESNQDTIVVGFQKVEFDSFMQLMIALTKEHSIVIKQMSVMADNPLGIVNIELSIQSV
jgi:general secretion pathway protein M